MSLPIQEIHLHQLNMRLKHPFTTSFGTFQDREFFITEIIDHVGTRGFGESVAFISPWYNEEIVETNLHVMLEFLMPLLKTNKIEHAEDETKDFKLIYRQYKAKKEDDRTIRDLCT